MSYAYTRAWKLKRYNAGLCTWCGKPRESERELCAQCQDKNNATTKERKKRRTRDNLCVRCGLPSVAPGREPVCLVCWFKRMSCQITEDYSPKLWSALKTMFEQQNGRCAYSDVILIPGINASIDHKEPRSMNGTCAIDNLQWVTKSINRLKGKMDHEDFVRLCHTVAQKYPR